MKKGKTYGKSDFSDAKVMVEIAPDKWVVVTREEAKKLEAKAKKAEPKAEKKD
jgi:sarcosine oxidase gamma subunit